MDVGNVFAKVVAEDLDRLTVLGETIWKSGGQEITLSIEAMK